MASQTKRCSKCGEEKSFDNYSPHPKGKHGLQARCKACGAAANSARYHANIEVERERSRLRSLEYATRNPERVRETKRRWAEANPDKDRAAKEKWASANPEKVAAAKDNWRRENLARFNEAGKAWKKANPEAMFVYRLRKYGLTPDSYAAMLASQGNRCAVCEGSFTEKHGPCIDHHHGNGAVRALLCVRCNAGLGSFLERPEVLESAARYLRRHNGAIFRLVK